MVRDLHKTACCIASWHRADLVDGLSVAGVEKAQTLVEELRFGGESRPLMGLVYEVFRGRAAPEQVKELIEGHVGQPFHNYEVYGNFYLGLYYDAARQLEGAARHVATAAHSPLAKPSDLLSHLCRLHLKVRAEGEWESFLG
jgi:hypothetical protein